MIVIIDNYDSFTYNLYQAVAAYHADVRVIRNNCITVQELASLRPQGIIISPGPGRPCEAGISITLIQQLAASIPILGVCLGHQSIAEAFGGQVVLAKEPVHGKDAVITHHGKGIYKNLPSPMLVGRYHSLIVSRQHLPACLEIEATGPEGIIMGIRHQHYPCFGVQFHPESILTPQGERLLVNFTHILAE